MQALVAQVLAAWRRAERLAGELPPGSPERELAERASERLHDLYRDLTSAGVIAPIEEAGARSLLDELADNPS